MKKLVLIGLLAASLSLVACGASKGGNVEDLPEATGEYFDGITMGTEGDDESEDYDYYEDEEDYVEHDEPYYPSSFEGTPRSSKITKLGNFKEISYSYDADYVPTDAEVEAEMMSTLEMYEETELTEKVVRETIGYDSIEEFRSETKEELTESKRYEMFEEAATAIFDVVIGNSEFAMDEAEIQTAYEMEIESYESMAGYFGMTYEEMCEQFFESTVEDVEAETLAYADRTIRENIVINAIIEEGNIDMASIWDEYVERVLYEYGYDDPWEIVDSYGDENVLIDEVKRLAVIDFLMENGRNAVK